MNKQLIIGILAITLVGGGAYYFGSSKPKVASDGHTDHTHDPIMATVGGTMAMDHTGTGSMATMATGAKLAGTRVNIKNSSFKAGSQNLSFELFGQDGHAFDESLLKTTHEKKMHFILVSNDFSNYQHLHPEFKNNLWQVDIAVDANTGYQTYIDVDSNEDGAETLRVPVSVGTPAAKSKISQRETTLSKDGVSVKMNAPKGFLSKHENEVTFTISQNGKTINPENYLGAKGHVVALGDDPNTFIHGHPSEDGDSEAHFAFTFEKKGAYTLFAQFKVGGVVRTYPFTVNVTEGGATGSAPIDESKPHDH